MLFRFGPCLVVTVRRYSDELRERVLETYHAECATSPHASDSKRKRLAPHVYVKAQALVVMSGLQSIYDAHLRRFPQDKDKLSFAGFKDLKPWYAIFGDRQTCLCKWCENFLCYQDALRVAATYLAPLLPSPDEADGDAGDTDEEAAPGLIDDGQSHLAKLVRVAQLKSKQMVVNEFVCGGSIATAKHDCVMGKCEQCGFGTLWSKGLRKEVVDAYGKLRPGVDKVSASPVLSYRPIIALPQPTARPPRRPG